MHVKITLTKIEPERFEKIITYAIAHGKKVNHPTVQKYERYVLTENNSIIDISTNHDVEIVMQNANEFNIFSEF
jgi:hypothetical protein